MNWLDWVLIGMTVLLLANAVRRGFSRMLIGLLSTVAAVFLGLWFFGIAASFLTPYLKSELLANFIGFFIVFFAVNLAGSFFGWLLAKLVKASGLSWADRLLGGLMGLVQAFIAGVAIVLAVTTFPFRVPDTRTPPSVVHSQLAPYVLGAARVVAQAAPREVREQFVTGYEKIRDVWRAIKTEVPAAQKQISK